MMSHKELGNVCTSCFAFDGCKVTRFQSCRSDLGTSVGIGTPTLKQKFCFA